MTEGFHTIDGETLMNQPLAPIQFVVNGLLSQGLHLLAGAPKCGKSWLSLWLSVTVAKGEEVWGSKVRRGTTLYLCFEDSRLRIQNRLFDITEDALPNVHFCEESCRLSSGLEQRIEQFIAEHPDMVLIIIDMLQMIRNLSGDNSYANDYAELSTLKKLADKYGIAILLIHHLRKQNDSDPFNRISGTTGLSGAVDSSFTLVEERCGSGQATLSCIGRDIEYREIELRHNEDNIWELVSDSYENPDLLLPNIILLVSDFMKDKTEYHGSPSELAGLISKKENKISERKISKMLFTNQDLLLQKSICCEYRRSNGSRDILRQFSAELVGIYEKIKHSEIKQMEQHLSKLFYKIAVEQAQLYLLLASAIELPYVTDGKLRGKAVRMVNELKGFVPVSKAAQQGKYEDSRPHLLSPFG